MGKSSHARLRARGRPARSKQQIEDRRAHIAACALKLFQEEGYAAISMRRLAEEAGSQDDTPATQDEFNFRLAGFTPIGMAGGNIVESGAKPLSATMCESFDQVLEAIGRAGEGKV